MGRPDTSPTAGAVRRARGSGSARGLWFSLITGPASWVIGLNIGYALVQVACARETMIPLHLVSAVTLLLAISGAVVGWREWRPDGFEPRSRDPGRLQRRRFMAALGLVGSTFFALAILAQWVGSFMINPCVGI